MSDASADDRERLIRAFERLADEQRRSRELLEEILRLLVTQPRSSLAQTIGQVVGAFDRDDLRAVVQAGLRGFGLDVDPPRRRRRR